MWYIKKTLDENMIFFIPYVRGIQTDAVVYGKQICKQDNFLAKLLLGFLLSALFFFNKKVSYGQVLKFS